MKIYSFKIKTFRGFVANDLEDKKNEKEWRNLFKKYFDHSDQMKKILKHKFNANWVRWAI